MRYFFHVQDGVTSLDEVGTELADITLLRAETLRVAGEILKELGPEFWNHASWILWVTDEAGGTVLKLNFSAEQSDVSSAS